jgi:zinc/manganese transport system substrate-binding protein
MSLKKPLPGILLAAAVLVLIVAGALLLSLNLPVLNQDGRIKVVASENFWGDIAAQIGKAKINLTAMVSDPSTDPHLYEPDVRDGVAIANADIVIQNGLGYDDFITKMLGSSPNPKRTVVNVAVLVGAPKNANPHLWYNLDYVSQVSAEIASQLIAKDPQNAAYYQTNVHDFLISLETVYAKVGSIKSKQGGVPMAYTEPVAAYMLEALGLKNKTPQTFAKAIEEGNEPSAADQAAMLALLNGHQVKILIYNAQAESQVTRHIRDVAHGAGIPVVGLTETMPQGLTYQSWQLAQLDSLSLALNNK